MHSQPSLVLVGTGSGLSGLCSVVEMERAEEGATLQEASQEEGAERAQDTE